MKTFTEQEVKDMVSNIIVETISGYNEWIKNETVIVNKETQEEIFNCEIQLKKGAIQSVTNKYIFPRLDKYGIKYETTD